MFCFSKTLISRLLGSLGLLVFAGLIGIAGTVSAQDRRQNAPGEFDFYVLSLSWSPSFCEEATERGSGGRLQAQCGGRPVFFVVHRVWAQNERGFSDYFPRAAPRRHRHNMLSMLGLIPAPGLFFY